MTEKIVFQGKDGGFLVPGQNLDVTVTHEQVETSEGPATRVGISYEFGYVVKVKMSRRKKYIECENCGREHIPVLRCDTKSKVCTKCLPLKK